MLIAASPIAMLVLDDTGCIASANAAAEMLFNASSLHLRHKPLGVVMQLPENCRDGFRSDGAFAAYGCAVTLPRGGKLALDFHVTPLGDVDPWRLVSLHAGGNTDRRTSGRVATGAAAMLAHEIWSPLAGIRGAAQL